MNRIFATSLVIITATTIDLETDILGDDRGQVLYTFNDPYVTYHEPWGSFYEN